MEDRSEEGESGSSSSCSSVEEEEKTGKSGVGWILEKGISLGKKVALTGIVISSAPIVLPPLVVISAIGFAVSVPFGFVYASYTCSEKLMSKLLPEAAPYPMLEDQKSLTYEEEENEDVGVASIGQRDFDEVESASSVENRNDDAKIRLEAIRDDHERELLPEAAPYPMLDNQKSLTYEEEEEEDVGDASIGKRDFDEVESASSVENRNDDAKIREEAIRDDQERTLSRDEILEEVGDASIGKGDFDIVELEEEERKQVIDEVENPSSVEGDAIAVEVDQREQVEEIVNSVVLEGDGVAKEEEKDEQGEIEPGFNRDVDARDEEEKEQFGVKGGVVASEEEEGEQEKDMKEGVEVRIELMEDGSSRNRHDDAEVRDEAIIKDDNEKELSRGEIQEGKDYNKNKSLERTDDIEIEELDEASEKEPVLETKVEKSTAIGDNVEPINFAESGAHKSVNNGKEEDVSKDRSNDKNVVVGKVEDTLDDKNVELNTSVPVAKEIEGMEKSSPLERNEEPIRISANKEDRTLEEKNMESPENTENKGVRDDAKGDSTVQPLVSARNEDEENSGSEKQEVMSSEDKDANLDDVVPRTQGQEKVKGDNNELRVKEREEVKGGETIAKRKMTAVEIEGRGKTKNLKTQKLIGDEKGAPSSNIEKTVEETKISSEKNDSNIGEETKLESNIEVIKKHSSKDDSVGVTNDNEQGPEMVGSIGYGVTILPGEKEASVHHLETKSKGNHKVAEADGAPSSDEGALSEEKVWTRIDAVRAIIGYREQRSASMYQEVKALYLFTGVEPPSSFKELADLAELYQDFLFLMSVIGLK